MAPIAASDPASRIPTSACTRLLRLAARGTTTPPAETARLPLGNPIAPARRFGRVPGGSLRRQRDGAASCWPDANAIFRLASAAPSDAWHGASPPSAATDLCGCLLASRWAANSGLNRRNSFSGNAATREPRARPLVPFSGSANSRLRRASPRPECLQEGCKHSALGLATSRFRPARRPRPAPRR